MYIVIGIGVVVVEGVRRIHIVVLKIRLVSRLFVLRRDHWGRKVVVRC